MTSIPPVGSRVSIRYRLPDGADKPLTDAVGHLDAVHPDVLVRTKSGEVIAISPDDVVAVRELSHVPVRTSQIRALEYAAALAWPGTEQQWIGGWLCRAGGGITNRANSAVPLDPCAQIADLANVAQWYADRGLRPLLALPERLLPVRANGFQHTRVMVADIGEHAGAGSLTGTPDERWLELYHREVPVDILTATVDGAVTFTTVADAAVGRGAVTSSPDGARWLGISAVHVAPEARRRGYARAVCETLLSWGAQHHAERAYVQVLADNTAGIELYTALGFRLHHTGRYMTPEMLGLR